MLRIGGLVVTFMMGSLNGLLILYDFSVFCSKCYIFMPVCSQKMGPPKYKNLAFYLNEGENIKSKSSSIVKWWPLLSKKCKCSQLAQKAADIYERVHKNLKGIFFRFF